MVHGLKYFVSSSVAFLTSTIHIHIYHTYIYSLAFLTYTYIKWTLWGGMYDIGLQDCERCFRNDRQRWRQARVPSQFDIRSVKFFTLFLVIDFLKKICKNKRFTSLA